MNKENKQPPQKAPSLFQLDNHYYAELITRLYPDQTVLDKILETKSNYKVLKNAQVVGTALKEQGKPIEEIEKRIKQYLKLNFR